MTRYYVEILEGEPVAKFDWPRDSEPPDKHGGEIEPVESLEDLREIEAVDLPSRSSG